MFGVLVADCFPVLLHDPTLQVGAAIHLGWRGAANCLLGKTVAAMQSNFGCRPENLAAAVGTLIRSSPCEMARLPMGHLPVARFIGPKCALPGLI